ncbi:MAG: tRNA pseudouridine(55) synthase TruB [Thermodesulfobacteriota bacterium]|nr:tRNA pseudouridine(55) synthase TruB [Thermodesulfobacteriota bacterium]
MKSETAEAELNGIIVVDKPADITSAAVVARVKSALGIKKIGHAGTLDPFATGLLICLVGRATRLADFFLHGDKTYQAELRLGINTDTLDVTGTVIRTRAVDETEMTPAAIERAINAFQGEQHQRPPAFSAVKHNGKPLYDYARRGVKIDKPRRRVTISALSVDAVALPDVRFTVTCSGGTYIRTLAADIGDLLGCGACLNALRRTETGGFSINEGISLEALENIAATAGRTPPLNGMNAALRQMPGLTVDEQTAIRIRHGVKLTTLILSSPGGSEKDGVFKVVHQDRLVAIVEKHGAEYRYRCVFPA